MAFGDSGPSEMRDIVDELLDQVKENSRRIRDVEEETRSLANSLKAFEERIMDLEKSSEESIEDITSRLEELSTDLMKIQSTVSKLKERLGETPKRSELEEVKSFVDLFSPLESEFMTEDEVRSLIKEELQSRK